jgi:hypothetical protein
MTTAGMPKKPSDAGFEVVSFCGGVDLRVHKMIIVIVTIKEEEEISDG